MYELQTDRLKKETGATTVECRVLHHDTHEKNRFVVLSGVADSGVTPQAVAFTSLATRGWNRPVREVDYILKRGGLMGETFRTRGAVVRQNRLLRARLPLLSSRLARLYSCSVFTRAELECYEFWADDTMYGVVVEIKNPKRAQAPKRALLGSYAVWRLRRTSTRDFTKYLQGKKMNSKSIHIVARAYGVLVTLRLYIRTRKFVSRYVKG